MMINGFGVGESHVAMDNCWCMDDAPVEKCEAHKLPAGKIGIGNIIPIGSMYGIYANIWGIDGKCHHIYHTWILWDIYWGFLSHRGTRTHHPCQ